MLHAVAVVKSGAFAVMRLTYYCFGTELIRGTWVHYAVMCIAMFSILYGSTMAVKETHFKRRLAFSTISNLSYILLGVTMMSPQGLLDFTTATACSRAVTGVGATDAFGSHPWNGNTAAFTPKPQKAIR